MGGQQVCKLTDCTEYRQTLLAKPPRVVRAGVIGLAALLGTAVLWAAMTQADLVVRAKGRVRPMIRPDQLASAGSEESQISPRWPGRVVEVHVREGDMVQKGDLLIQLDTERLENDIAKKLRSIQSLKDGLVRLDDLRSLAAARFEIAKTKSAAELAQAEQEIKHAREHQVTEIHLGEFNLELAKKELHRLEMLVKDRAVSQAEVDQAATKFQQAQLKLSQARLPLDDGQLLVLRQAMQLVDKEHAVELTEYDAKRQLKRAEMAAAKLDLANLELHRRQSELRAPCDGIVASLDVSVGEVVESGELVLTVAEQRGFRLDVAVGSEDVGLLHEGMPVRIKLDAFDYQRYGTVSGEVCFVSPDSELDSTSHQPVPMYIVKIAVDGDQVGRGNRSGRIKLGMTGTAEIVTDAESILFLLVRSIRQSVSLG